MFDPVAFHKRAVKTPSHEDVGAMQTLLSDVLEEHGVIPRIDEAGNVLAAKGRGYPHVVLNTHLDTVRPHVPYEREGDIVRGRGACDAKGPLAAMVDAFLAHEPDGHLTLAVTPDEELLSTGAAALNIDADAVVVGEPTGLDVCNAAKGRFEGTVTITGSAAHAATPDSGVNAIHAVAPLVDALNSYDDTIGPEVHDSLGAPTIQATTIEGGEATNQIPSTCRFTIDRRSVPPESASEFQQTFQEHLRAHAPADVTVSFDFTERSTPFLESFHTPASDPLAVTLAAASGGAIRPFAAATEASYFAEDAPTVVFGPGVLEDERGAVAHADREYIQVSEVEVASAALRETLSTLL